MIYWSLALGFVLVAIRILVTRPRRIVETTHSVVPAVLGIMLLVAGNALALGHAAALVAGQVDSGPGLSQLVRDWMLALILAVPTIVTLIWWLASPQQAKICVADDGSSGNDEEPASQSISGGGQAVEEIAADCAGVIALQPLPHICATPNARTLFLYQRWPSGPVLAHNPRLSEVIGSAAEATGISPEGIARFLILHELAHARHGDARLASLTGLWLSQWPLLIVWPFAALGLAFLAAEPSRTLAVAATTLACVVSSFVMLRTFMRQREYEADSLAAIHSGSADIVANWERVLFSLRLSSATARPRPRLSVAGLEIVGLWDARAPVDRSLARTLSGRLIRLFKMVTETHPDDRSRGDAVARLTHSTGRIRKLEGLMAITYGIAYAVLAATATLAVLEIARALRGLKAPTQAGVLAEDAGLAVAIGLPLALALLLFLLPARWAAMTDSRAWVRRTLDLSGSVLLLASAALATGVLFVVSVPQFDQVDPPFSVFLPLVALPILIPIALIMVLLFRSIAADVEGMSERETLSIGSTWSTSSLAILMGLYAVGAVIVIAASTTAIIFSSLAIVDVPSGSRAMAALLGVLAGLIPIAWVAQRLIAPRRRNVSGGLPFVALIAALSLLPLLVGLPSSLGIMLIVSELSWPWDFVVLCAVGLILISGASPSFLELGKSDLGWTLQMARLLEFFGTRSATGAERIATDLHSLYASGAFGSMGLLAGAQVHDALSFLGRLPTADSRFTDWLKRRECPGGGFSSKPRQRSTIVDTAIAMKALAASQDLPCQAKLDVHADWLHRRLFRTETGQLDRNLSMQEISTGLVALRICVPLPPNQWTPTWEDLRLRWITSGQSPLETYQFVAACEAAALCDQARQDPFLRRWTEDNVNLVGGLRAEADISETLYRLSVYSIVFPNRFYSDPAVSMIREHSLQAVQEYER